MLVRRGGLLLNSPLLLAAATGLQEVCDTLLDRGADKDVQNFHDHGVYVRTRKHGIAFLRWRVILRSLGV